MEEVHQSTENLTIGTLTKPTRARIAAARPARSDLLSHAKVPARLGKEEKEQGPRSAMDPIPIRAPSRPAHSEPVTRQKTERDPDLRGFSATSASGCLHTNVPSAAIAITV
jgi:hypothetical protein